MKIRIHFDKKLNIGSDGKIENFSNSNNHQDSGFVEFDLEVFNTLYQMFPSQILSFYNAINKAKEKAIGAAQQSVVPVPNRPGTFPVNGHDIFNYVAKFGSANFQIQTVLKLNGKLDFDKLSKAVRLSIDEQPIFGCRLVENDPPYWQPLEPIDETQFCSYEKTNQVEEAVQRFLESPLDMKHDPMVKVRLISSSSGDTLCLKINHSCCDGTGTKEYLQLLSDIYTRIDQKGVYIPNPKYRGRNDQDRLFQTLGIRNPDSAWTGELDIEKTLWPFPWRIEKSNAFHSSVCRLPKGYVEIMSRYAKARGATIHDLILTAFYRALFQMSQSQQGIPRNISMTVDLRRYLPDQKTEAIRNFSGGIDTKLAKIDRESFEGTLARVVPMMNEIKKGRPGLQSAVGLERVEKAKFSDTLSYYLTAAQNASYSDQCSPVLSNLGFLNKSQYKFGRTVATDAYVVPPAVCAPGILLCVGTYNGIMTFAVSYYESQVRSEDMNRLLTLIKNELIGGCKSTYY